MGLSRTVRIRDGGANGRHIILNRTHHPAHSRNVISLTTERPGFKTMLSREVGALLDHRANLIKQGRVKRMETLQSREALRKGRQIAGASAQRRPIRRGMLEMRKTPGEAMQATFNNRLDPVRAEGLRRRANRLRNLTPASPPPQGHQRDQGGNPPRQS